MGKWSRRAFITTGVLTGGAVIIGVAIRPGNRADKVASLIATEEETVFNIWIKIAPDNTVTIYVPHAEMGQGVRTTLGMMLADEMDADWDRVTVLEAPAHREYANHAFIQGFIAGDARFPSFLFETAKGLFLTISQLANLQVTGGSASTRFTGMISLRVAGAAAKAVLLQAAADQWRVPIAELTAADSHVLHAGSNRRATFASLAPAAAALSAPAQPVLKTPDQYKLMGRSLPRYDSVLKVDGSAQFGLDVSLPGLKYATVRAAPVFGAKVESYNEAAALTLPGVLKIIDLGDAVAVVADGYWHAQQALTQLDVKFSSTSHESVQQADLYEQFDAALDDSSNWKKDVHIGDPAPAFAAAHQVISARYQVPFLAHSPMEPMNCTAWVHDGRCELWTGSQNPLGFAADAAKAIDFDVEQVSLHNQFLGGGFGRRSVSDVAVQAARIAAAIDYPVKLIWSREEDIQHDFYRQACVSRFRGAIDVNGRPQAWANQYNDKRDPGEATSIPYAIPHQAIDSVKSKTHVPWGYWRSVDHSHHAFFTESFIDELAVAAEQDPFAYRRALLSHAPRFKAVLELAAAQADWDRPLPSNWGRGIAIQHAFGTIVAEVVEVEFTDGKIRVDRIVCAADAGYVMHPDGFAAQMEGGIIYGLTAALHGEITIADGAVAQSNFHDYPALRLAESPRIEVHVINSGETVGGGGEPSTPPVAPALANAIYQATGQRLRQLPLRLPG